MIQTDKRLFRDRGYCNYLIASWAIFLRFQVAQVTFWLSWATGRPLIWTPDMFCSLLHVISSSGEYYIKIYFNVVYIYFGPQTLRSSFVEACISTYHKDISCQLQLQDSRRVWRFVNRRTDNTMVKYKDY
jgi:hypothetical protein